MMIYGVLMCGGKGTRMKSTFSSKMEKPLIKINNLPLIEYIVNTLNKINTFEKIFAAVSNNTPRTREFLHTSFQKIILLETTGMEYSEDYLKIVKYFKNDYFEKDSKKILFLPIDIPLISPDMLTQIIHTKQKKSCLTIIIEKDFVKSHGITPSYEFIFDHKIYCYTGVSLIDISKIDIDNDKKVQLIEEEYFVLNYSNLAFNINTFEDLRIVEKAMKNLKNCCDETNPLFL